jgi:hypothetical protein
MSRPKVTVVVQTFNHERYIAEALDSVLMQRVDFSIEVIVGDNCSVDATREIIAAYQQLYPGRVRSFLPESPMGHGGSQLLRPLLERATGEYVAVLDGDDFWIHEEKLRRQVSALEEKPECAICFHDVVMFFEDASRSAWSYAGGREGTSATIDDLLGTANIIPTCSVVYRNRGVAEYPDWLWEVLCQDWALHILNARFGDIAFLPEQMAAYRVHRDGVWSRLGRVKGLEQKLAMLSQLPGSLPSRNLDQLQYACSKIRTLIAVERAVPRGDHVVLVVADGDYQLLELDGRASCPFPSKDGSPSHRPSCGADAVQALGRARADGAAYLVIPAASRWWLAHYWELADHLDREHARVWNDEDTVIYRLEGAQAA